MTRLLNNLSRTGDDPGARFKGSAHIMSGVALLGIAALCFIACSAASDAWNAAFRVAWLTLTSVALLLLANLSRLPAQLTVRRTFLLVSMVVAQLLIMTGECALKGVIPGYNEQGQMLLWFPYALAPTVLAVMIGRRLGAFTALCCTILGVALFPTDTGTGIILNYCAVSFVTGTVCALVSGRVHKREQILRAGFVASAIAFASVYLLLGLGGAGSDAEIALRGFSGGEFNVGGFAVELAVTVGINFVLAALVGGMMPALERLFNISTPITWLEWADMNHPLLRKLQIVAPGTFHHSLVVQRLSEAGAEAIGADVTRAGVCGLYHDIGKIANPQYFAENIADQNNTPHAELTPEASARIITGHVTEGVELAHAHGLNKRIVNVIREHHGVSTAYFFYRKALDHYEEEKAKFEEGLIDTCPEEVDKSIFTYKGPIPQTRESGIVSMADAVESATRSLQHPTEDDIRNMISGIFKGRILDGHLQDCGLTLGEIEKLKESFFATIRTMHHSRIAYPKPKTDDATTAVIELRKAEPKPEA
ncbi:MAG: HDIG domain-containing protein [Akkermansia sp.]|nr:HDIG domain-containing protein [Akkermansia sp.]